MENNKEIDKFLEEEWGTSPDNNNPTNRNEEQHDDEINLNEGLKKKYKAKTEKELQKDKGKYFLKIAFFF